MNILRLLEQVAMTLHHDLLKYFITLSIVNISISRKGIKRERKATSTQYKLIMQTATASSK